MESSRMSTATLWCIRIFWTNTCKTSRSRGTHSSPWSTICYRSRTAYTLHLDLTQLLLTRCGIVLMITSFVFKLHSTMLWKLGLAGSDGPWFHQTKARWDAWMGCWTFFLTVVTVLYYHHVHTYVYFNYLFGYISIIYLVIF